MNRHPGTIREFLGPGVNHCIVQFIGLEDEPASNMVGFDHRDDGTYLGLLLPTELEWSQAVADGWWNPQS